MMIDLDTDYFYGRHKVACVYFNFIWLSSGILEMAQRLEFFSGILYAAKVNEWSSSSLFYILKHIK